jgi:hypothetical protein
MDSEKFAPDYAPKFVLDWSLSADFIEFLSDNV